MPRIASPRPAAEHPPSRLTQAAASELATGVYLGQVLLDVNLYREAKAASALSDKEKQSQYEVAKAHQTRDVQACQNYFQQSEFVFDTGSWLPSMAVAGKWLPVCAGAAQRNSQRLRQHLRVEASEVATLNVISLNNIGPLKSQVMRKLQRELPHFDGVTLVVHPVVPRKAFSRTIDVTDENADEEMADEMAAFRDGGATDDESGDEMSDVDEAAAGGASQDSLPESVTKSSSRLTLKQRMANLSADRQAIERALTVELGTSVLPTHYANPLSVIHKQDAAGNRKVIQAVMIAPTSEEPTGLEQSVALRHGAFVDVENPTSFVVASRKEAARARREMMQGWSFDSKTTSCKYNNSGVVQGQFG